MSDSAHTCKVDGAVIGTDARKELNEQAPMGRAASRCGGPSSAKQNLIGANLCPSLFGSNRGT